MAAYSLSSILLEEANRYITRDTWDALESRTSTPLQHPVKDVYVTAVQSQTFLKNVFYPHDCAKFLSELQKVQMFDEGLPDIACNFYVGGDGSVYEGRGWYEAPTLPPESSVENFNSIAIAYIRPYPGSRPSNAMASKAQEIINDGVDKGFIDREYVIEGVLE